MTVAAPAPLRLRPYQHECSEAVVDAVLRGARRLLAVMATGGGKTIVFSTLKRYLGMSDDEKVLILAHRDELVEQARDKYLKVSPGEMIGIEKGKFRAGGMDTICVASVQTLKGDRIDDFLIRFGRPSLVITDEAHHAASTSYTEIYDRLGIVAGGDIVHVGVTATPKRGDNIGLDKVFDEIVYAVGIEDLIEMGYLADLRGYRIETETSLANVHKQGGDFKVNELSDAVNNDDRNMRIVRAYLDLTPNQQAIIFAADIAHSKELQRCFEVAGVKAAHVDGEMKIDDRRDILAKFKRREIQVVSNAQVLIEGYDEPEIQCVILARPTTKQGFYAQMVGRGTRLLDEVAAVVRDDMSNAERRQIIASSRKPFCTIIDVADSGKTQSLMALPSLLGLPAKFNLKGRSLASVASRFNKLADENVATDVLLDAEMLEAVEAVAAQDRTRMLLKFLRAADQKQKYVPLELLRPKPLPEWARDGCTLTWFSVGERSFRLNLPKPHHETIHIDGTQLGVFDVAIYRGGTIRQWIGSFNDVRTAIVNAERFVRMERGEVIGLIDQGAGWRNRPPSAKQLAILRKQHIAVNPQATGGDVSDVISQLFGNGNRKTT